MKIKINNIELFYEKSGIGTPLLLLHGNGENHHIFDKISEKLQKYFTVYAIDSINHGESAKTSDYSYEDMSKKIYLFIKTLQLEKANIMGFSDGAIISLLLAINHSEVIAKMALLGVNLKPEDFTEESYQYVKQTYEETKDPLYKLMLEQPNIEINDVKTIEIPTLIVAAEHDIFKHESFVELERTLANAELKIMAGHDHGSYIIDQDILYPDLIRFFN